MNFFKISDNYLTKSAALALVLALHAALLYETFFYSANSYKKTPPPTEAVTLFVNLINLPPIAQGPPTKPPKPLAQKVRLTKPQPANLPKPVRILVSDAPVSSLAEPVVLAPQMEPIKPAQTKLVPNVEANLTTIAEAAPKLPASASPTSVMLSTELSVSCPQRAMPHYPAASRRQNEQGQVVLRVELDENGHISAARVATSSGYKRLDEAGLTVIKNWQCNPSTRNGVAVRAIALQPFDFILEGR